MLKAIGWASVCILMDGLVTVMIGIIKGIGRQGIATCAYLVCFYLISVPASFMFCFRLAIGLRGLWIGLTTGLIVLTAALALVIRKADWVRIAHQAKEKYLKESASYFFSVAASELMLSEEYKDFNAKQPAATLYSSDRSSSTSGSGQQHSERGKKEVQAFHHFSIEDDEESITVSSKL